jgi:hypothetical protein
MFVCLLGAALAASVASRLHIGGWANVLSFWTAFGSAGIAVFGTRAEAAIESAAAAEPGGRWTEAARSATALPALLAAAQLLGCTYAPADHIPRRATVGQFQSFVDRVRSLEERGEVIYVGRGHVTKARHFHMAALIDVVTVEHALPEDVAKAFREQRFAAVVIDSFDDLWIPLHPEIKGELFQVVCANYYVAEKLDERIPFPVLGWPARPTWLLLPRGEKLDETDRALLERRSMIELQIATMREEATVRRGTVFPEHRDTMETVGKQVYDRVFAGSVERPDAAPPP